MKKIMMPFMLFLMLTGWVVTISGFGKENDAFEEHMRQAQAYEEKEIYIDALAEYKEALNYTKEPYTVQMKIMDMYANLKKYGDFIDYGDELVKEYNYPEEIVMKMVNYYKESKKKKYAIELLKQAAAKRTDSELYIQELAELRGTYSSQYVGQDNVLPFCNDYAVYEEEGLFGLLEKDGDVAVRAGYQVITPYARQPELATVKLEDQWFCIDKGGYRKLVPDQPVDELGMFGDGLISFCVNGLYGYMDDQLTVVQEPQWEYAGVFCEGTAAVRKNGKWALVNTKFENVTDYIFDEIVVTEYGQASEYGVFFAKQNEAYYLYSSTGEKISDTGFEEVRCFASSQPAAVCQNGAWGYVDQAGSMVISPQYDQAESFACDLAPVQIDGKWGYIDQANRIRILAEFKEAKPFSPVGSAAIRRNSWEMITLIQ